jgi:hypothetical protein
VIAETSLAKKMEDTTEEQGEDQCDAAMKVTEKVNDDVEAEEEGQGAEDLNEEPNEEQDMEENLPEDAEHNESQKSSATVDIFVGTGSPKNEVAAEEDSEDFLPDLSAHFKVELNPTSVPPKSHDSEASESLLKRKDDSALHEVSCSAGNESVTLISSGESLLPSQAKKTLADNKFASSAETHDLKCSAEDILLPKEDTTVASESETDDVGSMISDFNPFYFIRF